MRLNLVGAAALVASSLFAQLPQGLDLTALQQAAGARGAGAADAVPTRPTALPATGPAAEAAPRQLSEDAKLDDEIKAMKAREKGPRRFGADLFQVRQAGSAATEGGIAEDYVLGTGDRLNLNVFGSATFDLPVQVDGRGEIVIPKVGTTKVGGLTLGKAKMAVQGLVSRNFSRSSVDLQVIKLREVRVFVMGEVYKPGSYLVSSLSSLVNVLSLAGGPTAVGSFRDIRVMRGGLKVFSLDLYPLRAEGLGNPNAALQNGDTVFVPLAGPRVMLEGGFTRVMPLEQRKEAKEVVKEDVKLEQSVGSEKTNLRAAPAEEKSNKVALANADDEGSRSVLPLMQFELREGEQASEVVRFAGGLLPTAYADGLSLRRQDKEGLTSLEDIPFDRLKQTALRQGDILSAFPRHERVTRMVSLVGWVRVPGSFGRPDGLRVGALLKKGGQVLPDTYLERGEVTRTLEDGTTRYLSFQVAKALAGDPTHDLLLQDRDRIELFPVQRMRMIRKASISGPIASPGVFDLHEGMRVADLVFKGGILEKQANGYYAELARRKNGVVSELVRLDLAKLSSSETGSPVNLIDDQINPLLQDDDQITVFAKPDYRIHRYVSIEGQVARPGKYVIEAERFTLSQLIERAGGLTPEAMLKGGILLRRIGWEGRGTIRGEAAGPLGVAEILARLSETKLYSSQTTVGQMSTPSLFTPPIMHGLGTALGNRLVVDFESALKKDPIHDLEIVDADSVIIPHRSDTVMVLGEVSTPFAFYKVTPGMKVADLLSLAGGTTRNADTANIRLVRANGMILDSWVSRAKVEPGDALLVPQRFRRETNWQENLQALTPIAIMLSALKL